ncbi:MAG: DUF6252 family protein [Rufibacter sp.]
MKNVKFLLYLFLAVFCFSCFDEEDPEPAPVKDATAWKQEKAPEIHFTQGTGADSMFIKGYTQDGELLLNLSLKGTGTYTTANGFTAVYLDLDKNGTVANTYYSTVQDATSKIIITEWNPQARTVKGTFQLTLKKVYTSTSKPNAPEAITFTGGVFEGNAIKLN